MARNFLPIPAKAYIGGFSSRAFTRSHGKGTMITASIPWFAYTLTPGSFAVTTNLQAAGPNLMPAGWQPQSCYIDNEGVDFPVYVFFPDTQFAISCPANSAGWYEVYTNGLLSIISGIGITQNAITTFQLTRLFFTDVEMTPYLDQEIQSAASLYLASTNLPRFQINGLNYNSPALGDQPITASLVCTGGSFNIALAAFGPNTFYYVTGIFASATFGNTQPGVANSVKVNLRPHGTITSLWEWDWISPGAVGNGPVWPASGFNLKLDGNLQYDLVQVGGPNVGDIITVNFVYTLSTS